MKKVLLMAAAVGVLLTAIGCGPKEDTSSTTTTTPASTNSTTATNK